VKGSDTGLHVECTNTNLASLALGLRQVNKILMESLLIANCNVEKLYGSLFKPLSAKKLTLEDTPVKDISDGTFDEAVDALEELNVRNSWLTRMPPSIKKLKNLKVQKYNWQLTDS